MNLCSRSNGLRPSLIRPTRQVLVVSHSQAGTGGVQQPDSEKPNVLLLALKTTLVATAVTSLATSPAAAGTQGWHQRRHYRRLQDKYVTTQQAAKPAKAEAAVLQAPQLPAQSASEWQRGLRRLVRKAQRAVQGDGGFSMSVSTRDLPGGVAGAYGGSGRCSQPVALGWLALLAAVAAGLYLLLKRQLKWGRRRALGEGGRWVYDRSLGGKEVFVPEPPRATRSLWGNDPLPASPAAASAAAAAPSAVSPPSSVSAGAHGVPSGPVVPEWWVPVNTAVYVPASRREELERQAKAALRELEDTKLAGLDYPLSTLRALRTLCQEGGGLQVMPRTENGRNAMLRTGVAAAMECAMENNWGLLGGEEPARFVCGLAHDLGVPDTKAVSITHAEVAARCRTLLIDAEAAYRAGNETDILGSLLGLAQLLRAFPLPLGSAEAELLAGSIQQQTSLEFRRGIFFTFGLYMDASRAPIVAEMLGFNPQLVMPQLQLQIQAAQQADAELQRQRQETAAQEGSGAQQQQQQGETGSSASAQ